MKSAIALLLLTLPAAGAPFQGRVVDTRTGSPVYSALVRVMKPSPREVIADLETDRAGHFSAEEIPYGDYRLEISKPNFQPTTVNIQWSATADLHFNIRLVRLGAIEGSVLDAEGKPVHNALVYTFAMEGAAIGPPLRSHSYAQVDAQGKYRVFGLQPGRYAVGVSYSDNRPGVGSGMQLFPNNARPQEFGVSGGEEHHADFSIFSSVVYSLKGVVEASSPAGYGVTLVAAGLRSVALGQMRTGPDSKFEFEGVPGGSYDILVAGPTKGYGVRAIVLETSPTFGRLHVDVGADMENLRVPLAPAKSVSVILKDRPEGCPATASVVLTLLEDWGILSTPNAVANFAKEQSVDGLAPGPYRISVTNPPPGCSAPPKAIDVNASATVELPFERSGSITGSLVEKSRASEAEILLVAMRPESTEANRMVPLDATGQFAVNDLGPGHYLIIVSSGEASETVDVDVLTGKPTQVELHVPARKERP